MQMVSYVEEHSHDADNFFLVEVVEHFTHQLNNVKGVVSKVGHRKFVVRKDPKWGDNVVCNLVVFETVLFQPFFKQLESQLLLSKDLSQFIAFH
jgi:hypothetical protein